jgi:hypothetical protein
MKSDGIRDYFTIAVAEYCNNSAHNGLTGALSTNILNAISSIEAHPARVENRQRWGWWSIKSVKTGLSP